MKCGQTCPAELSKLANKGVRIFSVRNLHAKVFVLGDRAFIGSTNVSTHSAGTLIEAVMTVTNRGMIAAATAFVRGLCLDELGPEELKQSTKIYRPPRFTDAGRRRKRAERGGAAKDIRPALLAQLVMEDPPEGSEDTLESGRTIAAKRVSNKKQFVLQAFGWSGVCPFNRRDKVVQIVDETGRRTLVSPPGSVIYTRKWRRKNRKLTYVYLEVPVRRRISLKTLARKLGRDSRKRLLRGGRVRRDFAERLLAVWNL